MAAVVERRASAAKPTRRLGWQVIHHSGHAIGLRIHEEPDVNRDRGGVLEPGDVICLEPGAYVPEARHAVRIENTYLITNSGAEILSQCTVELRACS
jgi:Xaa-Pro aminopeptidase